MRLGVALVVVLLAVGAWAQQQPLQQPDVYTVESVLTHAMAAHKIPGASVGIVRDGQVVWTHGYGVSDVEAGVNAKESTEYRLASVSKPISAVAAMTLVEQHKLDLDAPVQKYCPAFPQKQAPVTMRELLSHTAGVRHYKPEEDVEHRAENTRHYESMNDALAIFAKDPLDFEPGQKFGYSTYGYTVVGCAIEGASGEKFYDYLKHAVLDPAGMTHTVADNLQEVIPNRSRGYDLVDGRVVNAGLMDSSYKIPGGGLLSDVDDMSRFIVALLSNRIVSEQTLQTMWTAAKPKEPEKDGGYGLGFGIGERSGMKTISHTGGQKGTSTIMYILPEKKFGVVILTNLEGQGDVLRDAASKIADGLLNPKLPAQ